MKTKVRVIMGMIALMMLVARIITLTMMSHVVDCHDDTMKVMLPLTMMMTLMAMVVRR